MITGSTLSCIEENIMFYTAANGHIINLNAIDSIVRRTPNSKDSDWVLIPPTEEEVKARPYTIHTALIQYHITDEEFKFLRDHVLDLMEPNKPLEF